MSARWGSSWKARWTAWRHASLKAGWDAMAMWHDRLGALLMRQREVFSAAWAARRELAGPALRAEEAAFLPAALAVRDTPMHPAPRHAAFALMAIAAAALAWSFLGRVDVVAVAPGKLVVSARSKLVQPLERAVVTRIAVRDGDRVQAGDTLVELDPTAAGADEAALTEQRRAAESEQWRARTLLNEPLIESQVMGHVDPPADWPPAFSRDAAAQLDAEWRDLQARLARADAERARREAERVTIEAAIAKLDTTLALARRREHDLRRLAREGFLATHGWEDRRRERLELEGELRTLRARRAEAGTALEESRRTRETTLTDARRRWHESLAQAGTALHRVEAEHRKTTRRRALMRLTAPVDGRVQQLAIHTVGGVVSEAQTLMVIVPEDAPMTAEVVLANADIGFVREGDLAAVKLETFPYTRHGTLAATVTRLSTDAVDDPQRGPVFSATLALKDDVIVIDGRRVPLRPGMALSAEIRTGDRRVIEFLLSPLEKTARESLHER